MLVSSRYRPSPIHSIFLKSWFPCTSVHSPVFSHLTSKGEGSCLFKKNHYLQKKMIFMFEIFVLDLETSFFPGRKCSKSKLPCFLNIRLGIRKQHKLMTNHRSVVYRFLNCKLFLCLVKPQSMVLRHHGQAIKRTVSNQNKALKKNFFEEVRKMTKIILTMKSQVILLKFSFRETTFSIDH